MKKLIIKILTLSLIIMIVYLKFNPLMYETSVDEINSNIIKNIKKGDVIKPFECFDFNNGKWRIGIIIHDRTDIKSIFYFNQFLYTENPRIINKFKNLQFIYKESDVATIENEIILYKNDRKIFRGKLILDKNGEGIQNNSYGYLEGKGGELTKVIKEFKSNLLPFVLI